MSNVTTTQPDVINLTIDKATLGKLLKLLACCTVNQREIEVIREVSGLSIDEINAIYSDFFDSHHGWK